jgi:hypothetical protein
MVVGYKTGRAHSKSLKKAFIYMRKALPCKAKKGSLFRSPVFPLRSLEGMDIRGSTLPVNKPGRNGYKGH